MIDQFYYYRAFQMFLNKSFSTNYAHFENNNLFYTSQYGLKKSHSTEYATLELIERVLISMDIEYTTPVGIVIDLSIALDTLDHTFLI